jgi:hypothetical protein
MRILFLKENEISITDFHRTQGESANRCITDAIKY